MRLADPRRMKGTDWVTQRDARLRRERAQRAARDQPIDLTGVKITVCPPGVAENAYDAGRNLRAAARVKAAKKRL